MAQRKVRKKISGKSKGTVRLEDAVDKHTYATWILMLKKLVPDGRTHRLSVLVASMLQYASLQTAQKANAVTELLQAALEEREDGQSSTVSKLVQDLFKDAKVKYKRTSSRGQTYSIADDAVEEFIAWDNMPWEG